LLVNFAVNEFDEYGKSFGQRKEIINEFDEIFIGKIITDDGPGHAVFERKHVRVKIQFFTIAKYRLTFLIVEFDEKQT
jgi:hypothetical protein